VWFCGVLGGLLSFVRGSFFPSASWEGGRFFFLEVLLPPRGVFRRDVPLFLFASTFSRTLRFNTPSPPGSQKVWFPSDGALCLLRIPNPCSVFLFMHFFSSDLVLSYLFHGGEGF